MIYAFYVLVGLLIVQGVFSLVEGIRFRAFVRRSLKQQKFSFAPKVAMIAPCKGQDVDLEGNLSALFQQDYPEYEIIFTIASEDDTARPVIERVMGRFTKVISRLVIAHPNNSRGEKVNNLLSAIDQVGSSCDVLTFVDSDARVDSDWLRALVAPLDQPGIGAATGYRWYLPEQGGFWSAVLSAWNGSVATTLGDHSHNFAWGGSTAIRKDVFDRIGVRTSWKGAVSDDYVLTRAVRQSGLRVRFVPRCLLISREDVSLSMLLEFTTRQIIITRVYRPRVWWLGLVSHLLFGVVFFGGLAYFALSAAAQGEIVPLPFVLYGIVYILGSLKGLLRLAAASQALGSARDEAIRLWWMFCVLWPLVSLIFLYNFVRSATTRRITWRGVSYEMRSPAETIVIR